MWGVSGDVIYFQKLCATLLGQACLDNQNMSDSCQQLITPSATYLSLRGQKLVYRGTDKSSKKPWSCHKPGPFKKNKQKNVFLGIRLSITFKRPLKCDLLRLHFIISLRLSCAVGHACLDLNSGFRTNVPVFGWSDKDTSYDQHNAYRPGQYFWSRYQNHDAQLQQFSQNTFVPTAGLARFQHPSHPELVQSSSSSLAAQSSPPAASPESSDVENSSETSERNGAPDKVTRLLFTLPYVTVECLFKVVLRPKQ